jgi:hypothetical protein
MKKAYKKIEFVIEKKSSKLFHIILLLSIFPNCCYNKKLSNGGDHDILRAYCFEFRGEQCRKEREVRVITVEQLEADRRSGRLRSNGIT